MNGLVCTRNGVSAGNVKAGEKTIWKSWFDFENWGNPKKLTSSGYDGISEMNFYIHWGICLNI